jgi:hypothetical protein
MTPVIEGVGLETHKLASGLSLLFKAGERPSAADIAGALESIDASAPGTSISHRPDEAEGWLELLISGLTFELWGLAPAEGTPVTRARHRFGVDTRLAEEQVEAVTLVAGPHIYGGRAMQPVVRSMTGLAASLSLALPVVAVCWEPAGVWMDPRYFTRTVIGWLGGGPFPALGLTAVESDAGGIVRSSGLEFFCGQEIEVVPQEGEAPTDTVKLALRVIDNIIRRGPIDQRTVLETASEKALIAEPSADLKLVRVWRGG